MLKIILCMETEQSRALAKLLERLNYEVVRGCVDDVEEARALLTVIEQLRNAVAQKEGIRSPGRSRF